MRQVLIGRGKAIVARVPAPLIEPGHVLVEVAYSLISAGTEISGVERSGKSLIRHALEQPDRVKEVVDYLRRQGMQRTVAKIQGRLAKSPTGYSCSGIAIQVGEGVDDIHAGDLVACAGGGIATHAEIVLVPRNLLVRVPEGCDLRAAASVTLGSIAMQGVRQADPRLGEIVAVIGLGLLGQLTAQLLKAAGCRVIGLDLDARRVAIAKRLGADRAFDSLAVDVNNEIRHLTGNHGADATIITAASPSNAIVNQAMEITRQKGRVVVVGAVGLGLKRSPFYEKEIELTIACSYGPGRYDEHYERQGVDYPYAYVRWTENRNMQEYLRLIAEGRIQVDPILEREYDIAQAPQAFEELQTAAEKPLGVLLVYPVGDECARARKMESKVVLRSQPASGKINVAVVGAGNFAKAMHLPNLQKLSGLYHLRAVVSTTGSNAQVTAEQFKADYATTDYHQVLEDQDVDVILIATRHHLHAPMAIAAAQAGKAIFLEKPMALHACELDELAGLLAETKVPFLVGYNRRFAPAARRAKEIIGERQSPLMIFYRVNAGYLPLDHWTQTDEGGGRIVGEACHMFDLFQYLVHPARVVELVSTAIVPTVDHVLPADNVVTTIRYDDGSVATLLYTALGASDLPKEYVEIYADGKVLLIDDYQALRVYGTALKGWSAAVQDKGHLEELRAFASYVLGQSQPPIDLEALVETARVSLEAAALNGQSA
jgi:predicted dehydrogenase/threonine dehydrogenase-like Zn-dependent dehydrogenase